MAGRPWLFERQAAACCALFTRTCGTPQRLPSENRPTRLAHVNLNASDVDGSAAFYEQALGFRLTDRTKAMAFVRCNGDHHAIVIADAPVNGLTTWPS